MEIEKRERGTEENPHSQAKDKLLFVRKPTSRLVDSRSTLQALSKRKRERGGGGGGRRDKIRSHMQSEIKRIKDSCSA